MSHYQHLLYFLCSIFNKRLVNGFANYCNSFGIGVVQLEEMFYTKVNPASNTIWFIFTNNKSKTAIWSFGFIQLIYAGCQQEVRQLGQQESQSRLLTASSADAHALWAQNCRCTWNIHLPHGSGLKDIFSNIGILTTPIGINEVLSYNLVFRSP